MKKEYTIWATRPSSVVRETPVGFYLAREGVRDFYCIPVDMEKSDYTVEKKSFARLFQRVARELAQDPEGYFREYRKDRRSLFLLAKAVNDTASGSTVHLWRAYDRYVQFLITRYCRHFSTTFAIEDRIIPQLSKKFSQEDMEIITSPGEALEYHRMMRDVMNESIDVVQARYGWMNLYTFKERPYTVAYFRKLKKTVSRSEVDRIFLSVSENRRKFAEILQSVSDKRLQDACYIAHECAFFKTDRMDQWKKSMLLVQKIFIRIARQKKGWTVPLCTEFMHTELQSALLLGIYPSRALIQKRRSKQCITEVKNGTVRVICDENEVQLIKDAVCRSEVSISQSISGTVASRGRVSGRVILVTDKSRIHKVSVGSILVAEWTTPEYLSAMKRASAIVTDEGGLTSHAAIVARELGKPCIIGTKIATKVLKDGDLVEVDANQGIVRVIKDN